MPYRVTLRLAAPPPRHAPVGADLVWSFCRCVRSCTSSPVSRSHGSLPRLRWRARQPWESSDSSEGGTSMANHLETDPGGNEGRDALAKSSSWSTQSGGSDRQRSQGCFWSAFCSSGSPLVSSLRPVLVCRRWPTRAQWLETAFRHCRRCRWTRPCFGPSPSARTRLWCPSRPGPASKCPT